MMALKIGIEWLDKLLPQGIAVNTSTLISGPGGTGKPLVELAFVSAWLKAGGSVIVIPLQYPTAELLKIAMKQLYNLDLNSFGRKIVYIQFDPHTDKCEKIGNKVVKANIVKPELWEEAIQQSEEMIEKNDPGILIFGSAFNLLLFSPTYNKTILDKLKLSIKEDKSKTYLFAVSTSAFGDQIKELEDCADNLMLTRVEKPMKLFLSISRMKAVPYSKEETEIPIPAAMLKEISQVAEATRKRRIPEIRSI